MQHLYSQCLLQPISLFPPSFLLHYSHSSVSFCSIQRWGRRSPIKVNGTIREPWIYLHYLLSVVYTHSPSAVCTHSPSVVCTHSPSAVCTHSPSAVCTQSICSLHTQYICSLHTQSICSLHTQSICSLHTQSIRVKREGRWGTTRDITGPFNPFSERWETLQILTLFHHVMKHSIQHKALLSWPPE